jgi:hypothetical protein
MPEPEHQARQLRRPWVIAAVMIGLYIGFKRNKWL